MAQPIRVTRRAILALAGFELACRGAEPDYDGIVRPLVDRGEFMGAVLMSRGAQVAFERAYGFANLEWNVPNTVGGKFRIGSISKQFTAACILIPVAANKLGLDAPITTRIPGPPEAWKAVTLHHLLTHTSAIPDFLGFSDFQKKKALPSSPSETILRFRDRPLEFRPGTEGRYSNSGYVLLAYITEQVSGETFASSWAARPLAARSARYRRGHPSRPPPPSRPWVHTVSAGFGERRLHRYVDCRRRRISVFDG